VATHPAPKQFCQFASIEIELISAFFKVIQGKNLSPCGAPLRYAGLNLAMERTRAVKSDTHILMTLRPVAAFWRKEVRKSEPVFWFTALFPVTPRTEFANYFGATAGRVSRRAILSRRFVVREGGRLADWPRLPISGLVRARRRPCWLFTPDSG
jgi:hypothetical protein